MTRKLNGCDCYSGVCSLFLSFDGLLEEKALELVMDMDVDVGGETLVYCLLLICIIYFEAMVSIAEIKREHK